MFLLLNKGKRCKYMQFKKIKDKRAKKYYNIIIR